MEMGLFRGLVTVVLLAGFIGLWFWSWSRKRESEFNAAAQLPLDDDQRPPVSDEEREHQA